MNISLDTILQAVKQATREMEVCTPSRDYYARGDEWTRETIRFIDPEVFLTSLREFASEDA